VPRRRDRRPGPRRPVEVFRPTLAAGALLLAIALGVATPPAATRATVAMGAPDCRAGSAPTSPYPRPAFADLETRYRFTVSLRYAPPRLDVRQRIGLCNRGRGTFDEVRLSVLARAFGEFRLREARVAGRPVRVDFPDPAVMRLPIPRGLRPGGRTTVELGFVLRPSDDLDSSLHARLSKARGVLLVADWFPLVSDGQGLRQPGDSQFSAAARRMTLDLTVDDPRLVVAAPGRLVRREGRRRVYAIEGARDLAFLVARRLERATTTTRDGVRVEAFARRSELAEPVAALASRALEAFAEAYGPYPWERLVLAPTPRRFGGHEYPGIVFIGQGWIEGPDERELRSLRRSLRGRWWGLESIVAHEVAHQWFYALVGSDQLREPWIDEAFAEFSAHHFFSPLPQRTCSSRPVASAVHDFPDEPATLACDGYVETVYRRGAVMVDAVRRHLGDERFFAAMRELVAAHRFEIVSRGHVVAAWRRHAPDPDALERLVRFHLDGSASGPPLTERPIDVDSRSLRHPLSPR
jgi:hypothetical protein